MTMQRLLPLALLSTSLAVAGCQSSQTSLTQLSLEVKPSRQVGGYKLSGNTNLPDGTELTIQGLRQLTAIEPGMPDDSADSFSILDRKAVRVNEGRWETSLQIWQPGPDGDPAESWQVHLPNGNQSYDPSNEVLFTVTTPPRKDAQALDKQWNASKTNPEGQQVGFTATGLWYLQAAKQLNLAPPIISDEALTGGPDSIAIWQNQGQAKPLGVDDSIADPSLAKPFSDAALAPDEILR